MFSYLKLNAFFMVFCFAVISPWIAAEPVVLNIPGNSHSGGIRNPYVHELLHLIFKKQNLELHIRYNDSQMSLGRSFKELASSSKIDVNWSVTSAEQEQSLRAIEIPIYKGLIGWRVFFIHQNNTIKFGQVRDLNALMPFIAVQRFDWPDYEIMQANGLNVEGNIPYELMHKAVATGLADYFPRSVLEIIREQQQHQELTELIIEPNLLLKYPSAVYFFVNKENTVLANQIETGFRQAIVDGSFATLFNRFFGAALEQLSLDKRRVLSLHNPLIAQESQ